MRVECAGGEGGGRELCGHMRHDEDLHGIRNHEAFGVGNKDKEKKTTIVRLIEIHLLASNYGDLRLQHFSAKPENVARKSTVE